MRTSFLPPPADGEYTSKIKVRPAPHLLRCWRALHIARQNSRRRSMRNILRALWVLCSFAWAALRTWWIFRGEKGVEADDPDKEREEGR